MPSEKLSSKSRRGSLGSEGRKGRNPWSNDREREKEERCNTIQQPLDAPVTNPKRQNCHSSFGIITTTTSHVYAFCCLCRPVPNGSILPTSSQWMTKYPSLTFREILTAGFLIYGQDKVARFFLGTVTYRPMLALVEPQTKQDCESPNSRKYVMCGDVFG